MKFTRRFVLPIVLLVIVLVVIGLLFLEVDRCLDAGGRWNAEEKVCEYA